MTDAESGNVHGKLTEQMYCSQQINVPLNLPYILKQYAKAAIRTQPSDLLYWSAIYFRSLADGLTPPVKDRIEYPPISTPSGLSPGFLRVLIKQFGKSGIVKEKDVESRWLGVGLSPATLTEIFTLTNNFKEQVRWLNFVAVAAGYLCPSLTQTMILICELLTDDPEGGPAAISVEVFLPLYKYLARLNCGPITENNEKESTIEELCVTRQHSLQSETVEDKELKHIHNIEEIIKEKEMIEGHRDSEAGLPVWEDLETPPFKKKSPSPSEEGLTSETGLVVFHDVTEDSVTPGYKEKSSPTSPSTHPQKHTATASSLQKEQKKRKTPVSTVSPASPHEEHEDKPMGIENENKQSDFEGIEVPTGDKSKIEMELEEMVGIFEQEGKTDIDSENESRIRDSISLKDSPSITEETREEEEKEVQEEEGEVKEAEEEILRRAMEASASEIKQKSDKEKAEKKRLKEEERAERRKRKEQKKAEKLAAKEQKLKGKTEEEQDAETKKRKKKKYVEGDEAGEVVDNEEDELDFGDDLANDESIEEESSTASSTISVDPDMEVVSSTDILHEDEVWVEIEVDEESLDDEEQKVIRKVKKRVKKKIVKEPTEAIDTKPSSSDLVTEEDDQIKLTDQSDENKTGDDSLSIDGLKGKLKEEVRVSGVTDLRISSEEVSSLLSEPEQFEYSFVHIPGIGLTIPDHQIEAVVRYMREWSKKQNGFVMPRNIRHFLCPPLDYDCRNGSSIALDQGSETPI